MTQLGTPVPTGKVVAVERRVEPLGRRADDLLSAARDAVTPAAVATMASTATVQTAPVTTEAAPTAVAAPVTAPSNVSGLAAAFGISPLATNNPVAPADGPALWALLAWLRRKREQTISNSGMTVPTRSTKVAAPPADAAVTTVAAPADAAVTTVAAPAPARRGGHHGGCARRRGGHHQHPDAHWPVDRPGNYRPDGCTRLKPRRS